MQAHNLFFHLTYEGAVDIEQIMDPAVRLAYQEQVGHVSVWILNV